MIPAGRVKKCTVHGVEFDGCDTTRCPVCREADKRHELEREAQQAVTFNHQLIRTLAPLVAASVRKAEDGGG